MGIIGKRFVSDRSLEVSMKALEAGREQAGLPTPLTGLFQ
jgi:hypothetical protein